MENTASTQPEAAPAIGSVTSPAERRDRTIALISAVLLLIGMPVGWLPGSTGDVIGMILFTAVTLALMAWILTWLLPRERAADWSRANRTALILGVLAVLTGLVFWTGIAFAPAMGAIALGLSLRESAAPSEGRGRATAAVVLGGLVVLAAFVLLLIG